MSVASPNARTAHGIAPSSSKAYLLAFMKLRAVNDPVVHEKISGWVAIQKVPAQIHPTKTATCRISSALLLQRLVRAFENRLSSSSDDAKKTKVSTVVSNTSSSIISPTNGNISKQTSSPKVTKGQKKILSNLSVLMQRKVKVTQLVQQAVQFVGSDVLKVLQVLENSPTVADVASACLHILNDENRIKDFYRIFSEASGKDISTIDESSSIFFGVFALQALQSLRAQAISTYEFSHDFEMIYRTCYQDQNFQICVHELNPIIRPSPAMAPAAFAPDTEARNICWKMARLLALKYDHNHKSDPEAKDHRRNHILLAATSIVLAANIGKSIKNGEVTAGSASARRGSIPNDVDFVSLVAAPVSDLLNFLAKNTSRNQGITPICNADIRSHVMDTCVLIDQLGIGQRVTKNAASSISNSLLAKAFSPGKHYLLIHDYRKIIQTLVAETQRELQINTTITNQGRVGGASVRTGIVNVLLLFPMVIGEPWGIHRDAPMITSKMLCTGENSRPPENLKDSVAVVFKMKPRPQVIKRKALPDVPSIVDSTRTDKKRAKTMASSEQFKKISNVSSQETIDLVDEVSQSPVPRAPVDVRVGEIDAPIVNDSSELNEWTLSILSLSVIKPSDALLTYVGENDRMRGNGSSCLQDVIVPVLNRGVLRIQSALRTFSNHVSGVTTTKLTVGRRDGQVYVNGRVDQNIQLCASVVGLYYYSLEAIIQDQMERMEFLGSFASQLESESFNRALLACCYSCVLKGVGSTQKMQMNIPYDNMTVQVLMDTTESDSFTFLKVVEAFSRALIATKEPSQRQLASPIVSGLPVILHNHVQKIEVQLIDSVLWNTSTTTSRSFILSIKTMKSLAGAWPPDILEPMLPEEITDVEGDSSNAIEVQCKPSFGSSPEANFLSFVLRKLLKFAFFRIRAICAALNLSNETALHTQILVAFRYLLRHHISIFNDRHVDQLLLCSIYGVCRLMKIRPRITFGEIIDAYFSVRGEDQGDRISRVIVRHVKLSSNENGERPPSRPVGNIVVFYNTIYIPQMQKYFLGSKSLKKSVELYEINREKDDKSKLNQSNQTKNVCEMPQKKVASAAATTTSTKNLQPMNPQSIQLDSGASNINLLGKGESEMKPSNTNNGPVAGSIPVDTTKSVAINSTERDLRTNESSSIPANPTTLSESSTKSKPLVVENRIVNGQKASEPKKVDTGTKEGDNPKASQINNFMSIEATDSSQKSTSNTPQGKVAANKGSIEKAASSADDKPALQNASKNTESTKLDEKKLPTGETSSKDDNKEEMKQSLPVWVDISASASALTAPKNKDDDFVGNV